MAAHTFTASHGSIRIKVRLLPTIADVHREFKNTNNVRPRKGYITHAFFTPTNRSDAKHIGTIVLPKQGRLEELIPHEVVHAVMHKMGGVHCDDDEALATAVGMLSARIARKIGVSA